MAMADEGFLDIEGSRLEYRMIGPRPDAAPTIVMLVPSSTVCSVPSWGEYRVMFEPPLGLSVKNQK